MVWSTSAISIILGAFGLYCHYRGTYGHYTDDHNGMLPICMSGAIFAAYAAGPLRLSDTFVNQMLPIAVDSLRIRCLCVTVTWTTIFGVTHILPSLINSIGMGCVFWFMTATCGLAALFLNAALPNVDNPVTNKSPLHHHHQQLIPVLEQKIDVNEVNANFV